MEEPKRQFTQVTFCIEARPLVNVGRENDTHGSSVINPSKANVHQTAHDKHWVTSDHGHCAQADKPIFIPQHAGKLKVPNCSFRRHAHPFISHNLGCVPSSTEGSSSSPHPLSLEDADKTQV